MKKQTEKRLAEGKSLGGRPLKFESAEELKKLIDGYFKDCFIKEKNEDGKEYKKNIRPLTITGLAVALDCDRETLLNYEEKEEFFGTIKRAKMRIHNFAEEYLYTGKNQTGAIFNLKNNYGWKDKTEIESKNETAIIWQEEKTYENKEK